MDIIFELLLIGFVMIGLLFVMSALAKNEKLEWAFLFLGIEFVLLGIFLIDLFFYSIVFFILLVIYILLICTLGHRNYYKIKITNIDLELSNIKNDFKIAYVADFQFDKKKCSYNEKASDNFVKKINEIDVDLILLGGDYVNYSNHVDLFIEGLKKISKETKVISIFGNHDHLWKSELKRKMANIGIINLENEYIKLKIDNQNIVIVGLEDYWTGEPKYPEVVGNDQDFPTFLLIHNPDTLRVLEDANFDLALAGHYHQGQVNLIPKIYVARIVTKYIYGMYKVSGKLLYVTSGIGGTFMRGNFSGYFRWNSSPEIVKINVKKKQKK